jgi:hypothetical protein
MQQWRTVRRTWWGYAGMEAPRWKATSNTVTDRPVYNGQCKGEDVLGTMEGGSLAQSTQRRPTPGSLVVLFVIQRVCDSKDKAFLVQLKAQGCAGQGGLICARTWLLWRAPMVMYSER